MPPPPRRRGEPARCKRRLCSLGEIHGEFRDLRKPACRRNDVGFFRMDDAAGGEGSARRAVEDDRAAIHHDDAADLVGELVDAMFDHDDRRTVLAIETRKHGEDLCHTGGIEVGGRFVEHQQARTRGKDGCDADALLLAARQFEDRTIAEVRQDRRIPAPRLFRSEFHRRVGKDFQARSRPRHGPAY